MKNETYGAQSNEKFQLKTTYCAPVIPQTASKIQRINQQKKPTKPKLDDFLRLFS